MTVDQSKLQFYSTWDIDQLTAQGEVAVSAGDITVATISNASLPNVFEVMFKPNTSNFWFQVGKSSTNGALSGQLTIAAYINGTSLVVRAPVAGRVRYYVWSDKVNY